MLKAVIFDLYETLITEFDPDWKPPRLSLADRLGISEEDIQEHWTRLDDRREKGQIDSYQDLLIAVCRSAGHAPNESVIAELARERSMTSLIPFQEIESAIVELVHELSARGFRLAVITNAGDMEVAPWPSCRLAPFFEVFVPSFEVGVLKPDPRIFERGLQALGVNAGEAIFVGDGGRNELAGARRAGLAPLWATWFLDRWPPGIRPNGFKGDEWRQFPEGEPPFPRLHSPSELLDWLSND